MSEAPTRVSPERREVCPPTHSASQPSASRRLCMKGKLIAAAATEMNDMIEPSITPRCIGRLAGFSGVAGTSGAGATGLGSAAGSGFDSGLACVPSMRKRESPR